MHYEVYDGLTGQRVGKPYKNATRARSRREKLDLEYGAYRYRVRAIHGEMKLELA